tara:strand:- start:18375 stop:19220 length:846 start_codon:yes stop_codon:yes gene_type:complete
MNFICGTYFKHQCKLQLSNYKDPRTAEFFPQEDESLDNNYVFCKPEHLTLLDTYRKIGAVKLPEQFNLITHNSDTNFDNEKIDFVLDLFPNIGFWYTQNLLVEHPKVKPIPIGIANPKWSHGNQDRFIEIQSKKINKFQNVYVNFNISTNPRARQECLDKIGFPYNLQLEKNYPDASSLKDHDNFVESTQERYLTDIASSYFTLSPIGNGIDCHKTWEAIYMKSIPIVTRWHGVEEFKKLGIPILIIDDWSDFKDLDLTPELYTKIWGDFDPKSINFELFK